MEPFSPEAPQFNGASSNSSPAVSSDSPGTATSSGTVRNGSVATTTSQASAPPPSVPAACLPCVSLSFQVTPLFGGKYKSYGLC